MTWVSETDFDNMAMYHRRRYATSRLVNWVSQILRVERRAEVVAIVGYAARKRAVMSWAREAVGGDDKETWQQRWVSEARVPEYVSRVLFSADGDAVAYEHCEWTQQAFVTYNSPDWIVKGAENAAQRFDGQDIDDVAAVAKSSALGMQLLQNMVEFIHDLAAKLPISATALALELCPQTLKDVPESHVADSRPLAAQWLGILSLLSSHWMASDQLLDGMWLSNGRSVADPVAGHVAKQCPLSVQPLGCSSVGKMLHDSLRIRATRASTCTCTSTPTCA